MAVNNDCPDCQKTYGQSGSSQDHEDGTVLQNTRTTSPEPSGISPTIFNPYYTGRPRTPANATKSSGIDRQEIIRRIKSGGSRPTSPELERAGGAERRYTSRQSREGQSRPATPEIERLATNNNPRKRRSPGSRPTTPSIGGSRPQSPETQSDNDAVGLQIERPRSALHRGDFRQREHAEDPFLGFASSTREEAMPSLSTSPVAPWHPAFPASAIRSTLDGQQPLFSQNGLPIPPRTVRERATSNASLASIFVYKAPTSPLVQSSRPDTPELSSGRKSRSPDKSRRHTFSPQSFINFKSALEYPTSARVSGRAAPPLRSEKTFPYQAHQPRRSLNATQFSSLPQTPVSSYSRRPSLTGDSPLHYAPMVGSYEESILRGRMSTVPSRPLNFMAQIGVLGKGDCKPNLRCPPHVSVAFPAVFYSYGTGSKNPTSDQPSPYVGLVDLENNLSNPDEMLAKRRQRLHEPRPGESSRASSPGGMRDEDTMSDMQARRRRRQKAKRRSGSPKAPPGGSYRIPQQGQLQIVIKNPNKTAVKLFLVPYDLSDMEPGQKTFIRQRSYSAGPVIDMPLSSRKNLGTDRPEAALSATDDPNDRPVLRYLIHMHICCPSKGRYFLYKSIRVVFANRVPDGKEKLRNEIQLAEPRYSTYKASRDSNLQSVAQTPGRNDDRRRSAVEQNALVDARWPMRPFNLAQSLPAEEYVSQENFPTPSLPRHFTVLPTLDSRPSSRHMSDGMDDPLSPSTASMWSPVSSEGDTARRVVPRLQDPLHFQRDRSRERKAGGRNESLLSKRLMDLAFQNQSNERQT